MSENEFCLNAEFEKLEMFLLMQKWVCEDCAGEAAYENDGALCVCIIEGQRETVCSCMCV
jgi:hypothetical protein